MNNKSGFLYLALSTAFIAVQFLLFIKGSSVLSSMDVTGWLFYVSCRQNFARVSSHPGLIAIIPS